MSWSSHRVAVLALGLAATVHLGGLMWWDAPQETLMAGGQVGAVEASLGDGFADLARGTLTGETATEVTAPMRVEDMPPVTPMQPLRPVETVMPKEPQDTANMHRPEVALPHRSAAAQETPRAATATATTRAPVARLDPVPQDMLQTLTAAEPDQLDLTQSPRPQLRSRAFEARHAPNDPPPPQPRETVRTTVGAPDAPAPRGNEARTDARAGQTDGTATAPAQRTTGQGAAQAGNAAMSTYPGQVMRRIQRVRRPRVSAQGAATVAFRIASNGALSAVSLARSSGSVELDRAALLVIQQAAPFPAPPPGAQRSFSIPIMGR